MGHSIYLADDEKSIRELLHSFLASDGYTVRSFESGDALLEAFRQEPAELVILDIYDWNYWWGYYRCGQDWEPFHAAEFSLAEDEAGKAAQKR